MSVGVFGGTFDPVHIGHLRTALELKQVLGLDRMLMIPCADPPHRETPLTPARERLAMLELAVADEPGLEADGRELARSGPSYSIDTLVALRRELGDAEPLCFCIGLDSLLTLPSWHRWEEFLDYAHIVVAVRPGWQMPTTGSLHQWLQQHRVDDAAALQHAPAGGVYIGEMRLLPVAATDLRLALATGESIRYLTTDRVIAYIDEHRLYQ